MGIIDIICVAYRADLLANQVAPGRAIEWIWSKIKIIFTNFLLTPMDFNDNLYMKLNIKSSGRG
jgi:hypothetical protein